MSPTFSDRNISTLHFVAMPSLHKFTDLSSTELELQIEVRHKNGKPLKGESVVNSEFTAVIIFNSPHFSFRSSYKEQDR